MLAPIRVSERVMVTRGAMVAVVWILEGWANGELFCFEAVVSSIDGSLARSRDTERSRGVESTRRTSGADGAEGKMYARIGGTSGIGASEVGEGEVGEEVSAERMLSSGSAWTRDANCAVRFCCGRTCEGEDSCLVICVLLRDRRSISSSIGRSF